MAGKPQLEDLNDHHMLEQMQHTIHLASHSVTVNEAPSGHVQAWMWPDVFKSKVYYRRSLWKSIWTLIAAFSFLLMMTQCTKQLVRPSRLRDEYTTCRNRVTAYQFFLFIGPIYGQQLSDTVKMRLIHENPQFCSTGFQGKPITYGLGVRLAIYMFWASSIIADHAVPRSKLILQKVYTIILIATFVATLVLSASSDCTFAIEIVIMYYLFWGGICCVYLVPRLESVNTNRKASMPSWDLMLRTLLVMLMTLHAMWFWTFGYDVQLARMPCGTYHFFFGKVQDAASPANAKRSTYLMRVVLLSATTLATVFWIALSGVIIVLFAGEIIDAIKGCRINKLLLVRDMASLDDGPPLLYADRDATSKTMTSATTTRYGSIGRSIKIWQRELHDRYATSTVHALEMIATRKPVPEAHRR